MNRIIEELERAAKQRREAVDELDAQIAAEEDRIDAVTAERRRIALEAREYELAIKTLRAALDLPKPIAGSSIPTLDCQHDTSAPDSTLHLQRAVDARGSYSQCSACGKQYFQ